MLLNIERSRERKRVGVSVLRAVGRKLGNQMMMMRTRSYSAAATATATASLLFLFFFILFLFFLFQIHISFNYFFTIYAPTTLSVNLPKGGEQRNEKVVGRQPAAKQINCDRSHRQYDMCTINGATVLDPTTATFFLMQQSSQSVLEKIRPYPRKWDVPVMHRIKEVLLTSGSGSPPVPPCQVQHTSPALFFNAGGYTGNVFHDFNDGFIPLFITVKTVFPDGDYVLVIQNCRPWWASKYAELLRTLSDHPIVTLEEANAATHCFPSAHVGLISHGFMTINPAGSINLTHFRGFLGSAYAQSQPSSSLAVLLGRPRLVLVTRSGGTGREILNQDGLKNAAEEVGFEVIVFQPTSTSPMREVYALISLSHAMMGVHGAGLTHSLFLRAGSVLMQVVPLGLEWAAEVCFGNSARELGVEYMEYKIGVEESSLVDKYGKDGVMELSKDDPKGWSPHIMNLYLKEQNVELDLVRFRPHLEEACNKAKMFMFMQKEG